MHPPTSSARRRVTRTVRDRGRSARRAYVPGGLGEGERVAREPDWLETTDEAVVRNRDELRREVARPSPNDGSMRPNQQRVRRAGPARSGR